MNLRLGWIDSEGNLMQCNIPNIKDISVDEKTLYYKYINIDQQEVEEKRELEKLTLLIFRK